MPLNRGVFAVSAMDNDGQVITTCIIEEAFGSAIQRRGPFRLKCASNEKIFVSLGERTSGKQPDVRAAGQKLYEALVAHEPVRQVFAATEKIPEPKDPPDPPPVYPLFVRVDAPEVENLPWEILFRQSFIVLDPRWPIARLTALPMRARPLERVISPELRAAFVIAAQGERGLEEWNGLREAIDRFKFSVNAVVLVSEEDVFNAVTADAATWGQRHKIEVAYTGDATSLISRIRTHLPNIIHVFSHGTADAFPRLELETKADREADSGDSSLLLGIDDMKVLAEMGSLWLVVLNCCRGGKGTALLHSFAQQLVAGGAPAVVAMRESVDVADANQFTRLFYDDLLVHLQPLFEKRAQVAAGSAALPFPELALLRPISRARVKLLEATRRKPEESIEWSFPVLYVHRDELKLLPRAPKFSQLTDDERRELVAELDFLRETRGALDSLIDAESAQERAKLDQQIAEIQRKIAG
jgi:hypothetical protein